jgi:uncharacterized protein DUF6644
MWLDAALKWLEATSLATEIRENEILFPWVESVHVLAIALVVGLISIVDLRLMGLASLDRPAGTLARDVLPCAWVAFAFAALTGGLLFSAKATAYTGNFFFKGKLVLLALAGLNMLVFHAIVGRDTERWSARAKPPVAARIAGGLSLLLWIGVVAFGRWIGFTLH